jgi:hypothetical protein
VQHCREAECQIIWYSRLNTEEEAGE